MEESSHSGTTQDAGPDGVGSIDTGGADVNGTGGGGGDVGSGGGEREPGSGGGGEATGGGGVGGGGKGACVGGGKATSCPKSGHGVVVKAMLTAAESANIGTSIQAGCAQIPAD